MSGPVNGIIGDEDLGIDLPVTEVDDTQLKEEQKAGRYSKTKEFKRLQAHMQARIEYFQAFLPNGSLVSDSKPDMVDWIVANRVIQEFQAVINYYDTAKESLRVER